MRCSTCHCTLHLAAFRKRMLITKSLPQRFFDCKYEFLLLRHQRNLLHYFSFLITTITIPTNLNYKHSWNVPNPTSVVFIAAIKYNIYNNILNLTDRINFHNMIFAKGVKLARQKHFFLLVLKKKLTLLKT